MGAPPSCNAETNMRGMFAAVIASLVIASVVTGDTESPVPFTESSEFVEMATFKPSQQTTHLSTLNNIRNLKSYCIAARRKAINLKKIDSEKAPILDFIIKFGKDVNEKTNIVTHYAKTVGKLKRKLKEGVNSYVITTMDKSVIYGKGVINLQRHGNGMWAIMSHKRIGLTTKPDYFHKMRVSYQRYLRKLRRVDGVSHKADEKAASMYLIRQGKHMYKEYFKSLDKTNKHRHAVLWKMVTKGALRGQLKAWQKKKHLNPLVPGGVIAAQKIVDKLWKKLRMPSDAKLRKYAKKKATKWMKSHKRSVPKVIESIEIWMSLSKKGRERKRKAQIKARVAGNLWRRKLSHLAREARHKARRARLTTKKRHKRKHVRRL